jgi:hypothetical protein
MLVSETTCFSSNASSVFDLQVLAGMVPGFFQHHWSTENVYVSPVVGVIDEEVSLQKLIPMASLAAARTPAIANPG